MIIKTFHGVIPRILACNGLFWNMRTIKIMIVINNNIYMNIFPLEIQRLATGANCKVRHCERSLTNSNLHVCNSDMAIFEAGVI